MSKYLLASFFGGLVGACCVLVIVYVTNTNALIVDTGDVNEAVSSIHSRINDFYIFAGIVITLLLAINIGVFVKADGEIEKHIEKNYGVYLKKIENIYIKSKALSTRLPHVKRKNSQ